MLSGVPLILLLWLRRTAIPSHLNTRIAGLMKMVIPSTLMMTPGCMVNQLQREMYKEVSNRGTKHIMTGQTSGNIVKIISPRAFQGEISAKCVCHISIPQVAE